MSENPKPRAKTIAEKYKLQLQQNGMIVLETRGDNFVRTSIARDLVFKIMGGATVYGISEDELTARQMFKEQCERYPSFEWKLNASNNFGSINLPKKWRGFCS